jgi:hypothetical protein
MRPLPPPNLTPVVIQPLGMASQTTAPSTGDMGINPTLSTVASTLAALINRLATPGPGVATQ